eukprot:gene18303-37162_t
MSELQIDFPEGLPVSARRDEIMAAMDQHQVIIVCGETGSGKTTQLPKIALMLGRGRLNAKPGERGRLIGHTQPRRIAASSVAKRIAEELERVGKSAEMAHRLPQIGADVNWMGPALFQPFVRSEVERLPRLLATMAAATPYHRLPVDQARVQMKKAYAGQTPVPLAEVRNFSVPGPAGELPVRFYKNAPPQQRVPLVVFFHGSGFCALDLDTHDEICRRIVLASGCALASVDYRLAPEHPFPAGPEDALA